MRQRRRLVLARVVGVGAGAQQALDDLGDGVGRLVLGALQRRVQGPPVVGRRPVGEALPPRL